MCDFAIQKFRRFRIDGSYFVSLWSGKIIFAGFPETKLRRPEFVFQSLLFCFLVSSSFEQELWLWIHMRKITFPSYAEILGGFARITGRADGTWFVGRSFARVVCQVDIFIRCFSEQLVDKVSTLDPAEDGVLSIVLWSFACFDECSDYSQLVMGGCDGFWDKFVARVLHDVWLMQQQRFNGFQPIGMWIVLPVQRCAKLRAGCGHSIFF